MPSEPIDDNAQILEEIKQENNRLIKLEEEQAKRDGFTIPLPLDWYELESKEFQDEWLVEPIIPKGANVVILSPPGSGKSLLMQEIAAAIATGNGILRQDEALSKRVAYLDFENSGKDIKERIIDTFGYSAGQLEKLSYFSFPECPPFDSEKAEKFWAMFLDAYQPELVIIDTMSRVVSGEENSADTYRAFYKYTGMPLKRAGVTCVRLDHNGKSQERGARGSSAKNDDPDFVLQMTLTERQAPQSSTVVLKAVKRRTDSVPLVTTLERKGGKHSISNEMWTPEDIDLAEELDELGLTLDVSVRAAGAALRAVGRKAPQAKLGKATRLRKMPNYHPKAHVTLDLEVLRDDWEADS